MREARSTEKQEGPDRNYRRKEFKSAVVKVDAEKNKMDTKPQWNYENPDELIHTGKTNMGLDFTYYFRIT